MNVYNIHYEIPYNNIVINILYIIIVYYNSYFVYFYIIYIYIYFYIFYKWIYISYVNIKSYWSIEVLYTYAIFMLIFFLSQKIPLFGIQIFNNFLNHNIYFYLKTLIFEK